MNALTTVFLVYIFILIYLFFFLLILYVKNKKNLYSYPTTKKEYNISVITPAYNEEDSIENTIKTILESDYPIKEIIVVDDGSKDKTPDIVKKLMKTYPKLKLISKQNSGKADSINQALKITEGELIAVLDADSYPEKSALKKMVGYFENKKVAAVTSKIIPKTREKLIEKIQVLEYTGIAFTRKLLDYLDSVFVTPGGLSIYRTSALKEIGGFDPKNITEDIEVAWHLIHKGHKIRMCLGAESKTIAPKKFKQWLNQRIRWGIGGLQTLAKYRSDFLKKGMFGYFVIPFVFTSIFFGLTAFLVGWYIIGEKLISTFFYTKYSMVAETSLIYLTNLNLSPPITLFYIVFLFITGFWWTVFYLGVMKEEKLKRVTNRNIFNLLFYLLIYSGFYYIIWLIAIFKFSFSRKIKWGTK